MVNEESSKEQMIIYYQIYEESIDSSFFIRIFNSYIYIINVVVPAAEETKVDWVIFPSNRGGFTLQGIPVSMEDKTIRCPFPEDWLGNPPTDKGMTFCHPGNWISSTETRDQAIAIANELSGR